MPQPELDSLTLLRRVISQYSDAAPAAIVPEATLESLNMDSLVMTEMLFTLEDALDISIAPPKERIKTVADLQRLIEPHMADLLAKAANAKG